MAEEEYSDYSFSENSARIRDLEEKQRVMKDRLLLIGENLVELKEQNQEAHLQLKKEIEILKEETKRLKAFLEMASSEFNKFARKEEVEILQKQAKMFQPLEFVRKKDLKDSKTSK